MISGAWQRPLAVKRNPGRGGEGKGDWRRAQQDSRSYVYEAFRHADVPLKCCGCTSRRDEEMMGEETKCGGQHSLSRALEWGLRYQ